MTVSVRSINTGLGGLLVRTATRKKMHRSFEFSLRACVICGGITFARTEIVGIKTLHEGGSCSTVGLVAVGGHKSPWARSIGQSGPQVYK